MLQASKTKGFAENTGNHFFNADTCFDAYLLLIAHASIG